MCADEYRAISTQDSILPGITSPAFLADTAPSVENAFSEGWASEDMAVEIEDRLKTQEAEFENIKKVALLCENVGYINKDIFALVDEIEDIKETLAHHGVDPAKEYFNNIAPARLNAPMLPRAGALCNKTTPRKGTSLSGNKRKSREIDEIDLTGEETDSDPGPSSRPKKFSRGPMEKRIAAAEAAYDRYMDKMSGLLHDIYAMIAELKDERRFLKAEVRQLKMIAQKKRIVLDVLPENIPRNIAENSEQEVEKPQQCSCVRNLFAVFGEVDSWAGDDSVTCNSVSVSSATSTSSGNSTEDNTASDSSYAS